MPTTTLLPDELVASTNLSGSLADIDEDPDTPDGAWMVATANNVNTEARVGFPTPPGPPARTQTFKAWVRKNSANSGSPTARIDLYENGSLAASGSGATVTSTTGQLVTQTFSVSLSDPSGAGVQAVFVGTSVGGSPSVRNSVDLGAINWDVVDYDVAVTFNDSPAASLALSGTSTLSRAFADTAGGVLALAGVASEDWSTGTSGPLYSDAPTGRLRVKA